jgi:hypothetical protein
MEARGPGSAASAANDHRDPLAAERQRFANALARHHHDGDVGWGCAGMEDAWGAFAAAGELMDALIVSGVLMMAEEPTRGIEP